MLEAAKALQREAQRAADDVSNLAARLVTVPPLQVPWLPGPGSCCMGRDGYQQHMRNFATACSQRDRRQLTLIGSATLSSSLKVREFHTRSLLVQPLMT